MNKNEYLGVKLTKDTKDKIRAAADKEHITMSSWLYRAIQKELNK